MAQIEELDIENKKGLDFDKLYNKAFVDLDTEVKRPDTLLSMGEHTYKGKPYPIDLMTGGEFSVITAPSKTKKSYLKSALSACYIGGKSNNFFPDIRSHRDLDYDIIDCDTEQSEFYAQRTFRRTMDMAGANYDNYHPMRLRFMTANERLQFIDTLLKSNKVDKPKLMFIDGIADLIDDTNDLVMSNEVASYLLRWTDELKIHICVIIHTSHGVSKPTGHLGSAVTKKAETVLNLEKDGEGFDAPTKVHQSYSRGFPIEDFWFEIKDGLPYSLSDYVEEDEDDPFPVYQ